MWYFQWNWVHCCSCLVKGSHAPICRLSQESTWRGSVVYSTLCICLHLQEERVKPNTAQLLMKHAHGKEAFSWDEHMSQCCFLSTTPSFSAWQRNSLLGWAITRLMTNRHESSFPFISLSSVCRQHVFVCLNLLFFPMVTVVEGNP